MAIKVAKNGLKVNLIDLSSLDNGFLDLHKLSQVQLGVGLVYLVGEMVDYGYHSLLSCLFVRVRSETLLIDCSHAALQILKE